MQYKLPLAENPHSNNKKQRLSINELAFIPEKIIKTNRIFKQQIKRKFSQNDIKHPIQSGLNKQQFKDKPSLVANPTNQIKKEPKNIVQSNQFTDEKSGQQIQKFITLEINRPKINHSNIKSMENITMNSNKRFLPSILKVIKLQKKQQKQDDSPSSQKQQFYQHKRSISVDFSAQFVAINQQTTTCFRKLRSESLDHLKNKLKLQNAAKQAISSKYRSQNDTFENGKTSKDQSQDSSDSKTIQSPKTKQKKFNIKNLNLQTPPKKIQTLTKRSFIIKYLQKNEKELLQKSQSRKNSYNNLVEKQRSSNKISSIHFCQDENFITRSITFSHPEDLLLKKIMGKINGQDRERKQMRKQWKQNNIKLNLIKPKKQKINGWDIQKQPQSQLFENQS